MVQGLGFSLFGPLKLLFGGFGADVAAFPMCS